MLIEAFRDKLLIEACCERPSDGLIQIPNSENDKDLKKVFVDCSDADDAILIRFERKNRQLCPLFRSVGASPHQKACDGILLIAKGGQFHAVFCELKTKWNRGAIKQIRNSHLFFNYAHAVANEWHGAAACNVSTWFAVITTSKIPVKKFKTKYDHSAIPHTHQPSGNVLKPRSLQLSGHEGQNAKNPLKLSKLAKI